jgi:hypothetical protein
VRALVLALAVMLPAAAGAHDFWIEPSTFAPVVAQRVDVGLCEGDGFDCRPLPRDDGRIEEFAAHGPRGTQPILGLQRHAPAGLARFGTPGSYVLVYRSRPAFTRLDAWRFEQHLAEKGLDSISALRRARGASGNGAREAYSRYAKALLNTGNPRSQLFDRPLGLKLELIAQSNETFQVLFDGKPLPSALVTALCREGTLEPLAARTDANGRVKFRLRDHGVWRLSAVHMIPAPRQIDADWESFWASLTFKLNPRPTPRASRATQPSAEASPRAPRGSAD